MGSARSYVDFYYSILMRNTFPIQSDLAGRGGIDKIVHVISPMPLYSNTVFLMPRLSRDCNPDRTQIENDKEENHI